MENSANEYGERTPQPTHYQRMIDKTLSQIDEDTEEDGFSQLRSQATPATPIQYIEQTVDDISPVQYQLSGGRIASKSDHIHYNLSQQLSGSYKKTRNAAGGGGTNHGMP